MLRRRVAGVMITSLNSLQGFYGGRREPGFVPAVLRRWSSKCRTVLVRRSS